MDRVRDRLVLTHGEEPSEEARTRGALLHMLEELQRERDVIRRARRHWVDTFDSVRDPMMVHDEEHRVVRCNRAYAALAGTDIREIVGKRYWQMFPKLGGPLPGCRHVAAGPEATVEEEFRLASGETYLSKSSPVSEDGRTTHFLHIMQDITERNRVREAVERSERRYRALAENSSDLVVVLDAQGTIAYASPSVRQIVGYDVDEVLGKPYFDFVHPDDLAAARARFPEIVANPGPVAQMEFRYRHRSGSWVVLESIARNALDDPLVAGIVVNARDVTERKLAEETQQFTNAVLVAQQELSLDGILVVDQNQKIVSFNQRFVEMWRIPDEVIALRSDEAALQSVLDNFESPDEFLDGVKRIYAQKDLKLHDELRLKGGRTFERYSSPMVSADGKYYGRVHYFRDITERKRAEETLREALVATIEAIASTVEARDPYTAGHQQRVADLAAAIAHEMGLEPDAVEGIRFGALIHDLGKVQVPAELLSKPTRLTKPEFELIKTHPQAGYEIVKGIKFPWPVADMVHQHHERLDGSGYPQGLTGDAIALEARILTVADVVEAMSSHRPYRPGLGIDAALKEVEEKRGKWFDPQVVDACLRLFREKSFVLAKS